MQAEIMTQIQVSRQGMLSFISLLKERNMLLIRIILLSCERTMGYEKELATDFKMQ